VSACKAALTSAGFQYATAKVDSDKPEGEFVGLSPRNRAVPGQVVTIRISNGKDYVPPPPPDQTPPPDQQPPPDQRPPTSYGDNAGGNDGNGDGDGNQPGNGFPDFPGGGFPGGGFPGGGRPGGDN
jgi:beta-lactam-binding protein with PASTA domain